MSSNNPATFSSNEVTGLPGLAGAKSNVDCYSRKCTQSFPKDFILSSFR